MVVVQDITGMMKVNPMPMLFFLLTLLSVLTMERRWPAVSR